MACDGLQTLHRLTALPSWTNWRIFIALCDPVHLSFSILYQQDRILESGLIVLLPSASTFSSSSAVCSSLAAHLYDCFTNVLNHFLLDFHWFTITTAAVSHRDACFTVPKTLPCFKAFLLQRLPDPRAITVGSESLEELLLGQLERQGCHLGLGVGG